LVITFSIWRKEKLKSIYEEEPYIILSSLNKRQVRRASEEKDPTKPVIQDFWIDGNYRIAKSKITDDKLDRFVEATYKEFTDVKRFFVPKQSRAHYFRNNTYDHEDQLLKSVAGGFVVVAVFGAGEI
jgi:hypothetical protein